MGGGVQGSIRPPLPAMMRGACRGHFPVHSTDSHPAMTHLEPDFMFSISPGGSEARGGPFFVGATPASGMKEQQE